MPWYQHFTTSTGLTESITGAPEVDRTSTFAVNPHWGLTLDVREAQRSEHMVDAGHGDQASVGAFYQFTPSLRLGGELSVETAPPPGTPEASLRQQEPHAGVKIESAFRF